MSATSQLTPEKALIFRITHKDNVPWILDHGLHCQSSAVCDPQFVSIGSEEIIGRRARCRVPIPPGGVLGDYVPFYFTPLSPMLYNIKTGAGGIVQRDMSDLVILVSSLHHLAELGQEFVFTDGHAISNLARFYSALGDLDRISWSLLQDRAFRRDPESPEKFERYMAEALVHQHLPLEALKGVVCYTESEKARIDAEISRRGKSLDVKVFPGWFF